ncbi:hypothetical protein [Paenibacillus chibensis]|uniref:hypothetical protein n=1 Tax=Paenibacillus chibensis TaxID=59846 RepID=UPI000FDB7684|nr:hypothetical protein [Paenibacillus chibensis]MEC0369996.1 hypothetical protein [Paenibacillus chibensis]
MSDVKKGLTPTVPVIPAEVADVIERLRAEGYDNSGIVALESRTGGGLHSDPITLRTILFDTLLAALVNGYEREKTPEDKIRAVYEEPADGEYAQGYEDGIVFTLDTLGIKIAGVNA